MSRFSFSKSKTVNHIFSTDEIWKFIFFSFSLLDLLWFICFVIFRSISFSHFNTNFPTNFPDAYANEFYYFHNFSLSFNFLIVHFLSWASTWLNKIHQSSFGNRKPNFRAPFLEAEKIIKGDQQKPIVCASKSKK